MLSDVAAVYEIVSVLILDVTTGRLTPEDPQLSKSVADAAVHLAAYPGLVRLLDSEDDLQALLSMLARARSEHAPLLARALRRSEVAARPSALCTALLIAALAARIALAGTGGLWAFCAWRLAEVVFAITLLLTAAAIVVYREHCAVVQRLCRLAEFEEPLAQQSASGPHAHSAASWAASAGKAAADGRAAAGGGAARARPPRTATAVAGAEQPQLPTDRESAVVVDAAGGRGGSAEGGRGGSAEGAAAYGAGGSGRDCGGGSRQGGESNLATSEAAGSEGRAGRSSALSRAEPLAPELPGDVPPEVLETVVEQLRALREKQLAGGLPNTGPLIDWQSVDTILHAQGQQQPASSRAEGQAAQRPV
jgi:hypothetical protein